MLIGVVLLAVGVWVGWKPVDQWSQGVYWYQYKPTYFVMQDLKHGNGQPAPANNLLDDSDAWRGWLMVRTSDLARVALDELLRREKRGKLPADYRREIDEMELANMSSSATPPVADDLNEDLVSRLADGKLPADVEAKFYQRAIAPTLSVPPVVMRWDDVVFNVNVQSSIPVCKDQLRIITAYRSIRLDGN